jgi:hypothetical protein
MTKNNKDKFNTFSKDWTLIYQNRMQHYIIFE